MASWTKADHAAFQAEIETIEAAMGEALVAGVPAAAEALDPLLRRHHAWVALSWKAPPSAAAYAGLADLYLDNDDFRARYEAVRPGLAEYLAAAMRAYADRALA